MRVPPPGSVSALIPRCAPQLPSMLRSPAAEVMIRIDAARKVNAIDTALEWFEVFDIVQAAQAADELDGGSVH